MTTRARVVFGAARAQAAPACRAATRRTPSPPARAARSSRCRRPRRARRCSARSSASRTPACRRASSPFTDAFGADLGVAVRMLARRRAPPATTWPATAAGLSRCCTSCPRRAARCRSISSAGNDGRSVTSAIRFERRREVLRQRPRRAPSSHPSSCWSCSDAPSCATSSAICSALRVAVPSSSIAATKLASPGLVGGFASLPVLSTRLAATIGTPATLVQDQRQAVRTASPTPASTPEAAAPGPASASRRRHGSSALIDFAAALALRGSRRSAWAARPVRGRLARHGVQHDARASSTGARARTPAPLPASRRGSAGCPSAGSRACPGSGCTS